MRAHRTAASTLGLLGLLTVAFGGLQTGGSEVQRLADPVPLVGKIIEIAELSEDDMHW
jgi:hypothetical protein